MPRDRNLCFDWFHCFLARFRVQPVGECLRFRTPCGLRRAHDKIGAARRMLTAEWRHQLALRNQLIDQRTAAERHALTVDGRLHQKGGLVKADRPYRPRLGNTERGETLRPAEPSITAEFSV